MHCSQWALESESSVETKPLSLWRPCRPEKLVWHGSSAVGIRLTTNYCEAWRTADMAVTGQAALLQTGRLLGQHTRSCSNHYIVLCIENTYVGSTHPRRTWGRTDWRKYAKCKKRKTKKKHTHTNADMLTVHRYDIVTKLVWHICTRSRIQIYIGLSRWRHSLTLMEVCVPILYIIPAQFQSRLFILIETTKDVVADTDRYTADRSSGVCLSCLLHAVQGFPPFLYNHNQTN